LEEGHAIAKELEQLLRVSKTNQAINPEAATSAYRRVLAVCSQCHAKYRDGP
jgi:hypothetical protein